MVCSYRTYSSAKIKNVKVVGVDRCNKTVLASKMIRPTKNRWLRSLAFADITIHVHVEGGIDTEKDVNCDIAFMMSSIHEIGKSIRDKMD